MARIGNAATQKTLQFLTAPAGLSSSIGAISREEAITLPVVGVRQILAQNVAADIVERDLETSYPAIHLYCEKLTNTLKETFRTFSGQAQMAVEVRVSTDRLQGIEQRLQLYVDAVAQVLEKNRGDWGGGMFYTGGYEAVFGGVKRGGKNYIQTAKITFELQVSV
jgi:hypothetical protein